MAINPGSRTPAEQGLQWWPRALPDSPLWRWIPLLVAIQAQQPNRWRWTLVNTNDAESKNLLFDVLATEKSPDKEHYDLVIMNTWCETSDPIAQPSPSQDCSLQSLNAGGLLLSLPQSSIWNRQGHEDLFWIQPDLAIYRQNQSDWLINLKDDLADLIDRGLYLQRLADSHAMNVRSRLKAVTDQYEHQAREQHQLLLSYSERLQEMKDSSSWRLTTPLRQLADRLRNQSPAGDLPTVPPLMLAEDIPAARSPVDAALEQSGQSNTTSLLEQQGHQLHRDDRKTVLVVIHEASLTGAPILAWNLTNDLKEDHNLIILSLRRGSLEPNLLDHCTWLITPRESNQSFDYELAVPLLKQFMASETVSWALTNSIETWRWPKLLHQHRIPTVMLIHEFATYCTENDAFRDACQWSTKVVFSSPATHADMKRVFPELAQTPIELLPQGRCQIPGQTAGSQSDAATQPFHLSAIPELNRKHDNEWLEQCLLIVGSGTLAPRKGADLFISVCSRVLQRTSQPVLCLWLAGPDKTSDYKATRMWCDDQIRRSGNDGRVVILHAHEHYESLMRRADLFLLTSRLDPLPNVTLDSLHNGVPTLTFSQASGTASWLERDPWLSQRCVAPYLDTMAMADQAYHLLIDEEERIEVGTRSQVLAKQTFSMQHYKQQIRCLGELSIQSKEQHQDATEQIIRSGVFDPNMALSPHTPKTTMDTMVRQYIQCWERKVAMRKPFAGFHPGLFADHHPNRPGDPLQTWLRDNRPPGPWQQEVLLPRSEASRSQQSTLRTGLHIHVHHLDLLAEITERLAFNQTKPKLWISMTDPNLESSIKNLLGDRCLDLVKLHCYPNRGRNFGPLLQGLGRELDQQCDVYAHLHTKRSQHLDADSTAQWRRFLLDHLLGQNGCPVMDTIVDAFEQNADLGMVYADDPHCIGWTTNQGSAQLLMDYIELNKQEQDAVTPPQITTVDFPIGSMFWIRSHTLSKLWECSWAGDAIPKEPLPSDGTVLHALERLLPGLCRLKGLTTAVTHIPGSNR